MSEVFGETDGLTQIRDLISRDNQPPMGRTLGIRLVDCDRGKSVFEGVPAEMHFNPMGGVHGGYAASLLDSACGIAVHTMLPPGQGFTTLELKVSYIRGMSAETGTVRAIGRVVNMGRRVAFAEAEIRDSNDRLMATATSTLLVLSK